MRPCHSLSDQTAFAEQLARFIADEVSVGDEPVGRETDLVMTGLVDSLGVVRIVGWIQDRMGVEIDPADVVIEHFGSVASIVGYLAGRGDVELR